MENDYSGVSGIWGEIFYISIVVVVTHLSILVKCIEEHTSKMKILLYINYISVDLTF